MQNSITSDSNHMHGVQIDHRYIVTISLPCTARGCKNPQRNFAPRRPYENDKPKRYLCLILKQTLIYCNSKDAQPSWVTPTCTTGASWQQASKTQGPRRSWRWRQPEQKFGSDDSSPVCNPAPRAQVSIINTAEHQPCMVQQHCPCIALKQFLS